MPGRLEFDLGFPHAERPRRDSEPMRLLIAGDFSGTPPGERIPLDARRPVRVDVDNFDDVLGRMRPRLMQPAGEVQFERIDDFHPDQLFARLNRFESLRRARAQEPPADDQLLGRLLGKPSEPEAQGAAPRGFDAFVHSVVAPHVVKDTSAAKRTYLGAVDTAIAGDMRALLHDPAFQALEAAWRGVRWLVSNLELDENLQLHLLDVTRDELTGDVVAARSRMEQTSVYRQLVERERTADARRWSALVGLYEFGSSDADIGLLAALGLLASHAGGPLLAGADLVLAGAESGSAAAWQALRRSEAAPWIGLAAPRVLLRLPYGVKGEPIESFAFEEFAGAPPRHELLWGSGALAAALLIGKAFTARGWDMEPGDEREITDVPAYAFERDGERVLQPCTEHLLVERQIDAMLKAGLIPIAAHRERNLAVVVRYQSIADPPAPLAW
jgi:type VI secretion system protein ImpC